MSPAISTYQTLNPMELLSDPFSPASNGGPWIVSHPPVSNPDGTPAHPVAMLDAMLASRPENSSTFIQGCAACAGFHGVVKQTAPVGPFILPVPDSVPFQSIEVHTLRYGNPSWLAECAPTLDAWCARHDIPLRITGSWDPAYPDPKFCEVDMLRSFLAGNSEWMIYVDADVIVHPLAPRPHFEHGGFYLRVDRYQYNDRQRSSWKSWCEMRFGLVPPDSWLYRNAGVWACDRAAAVAMLEVIEEPYFPGIMEQHHWNWWLCLAHQSGMPVHDLPHEWNRVPEEPKPSWFFHVYAKDKVGNMLKFRRAGVLPDAVKRLDSPPPVPDFGKGAVVWPWKSSAAEWDELWYSHRSVIKHWSEKDWPLVLLADLRPDWWPGQYIHAPSYEHALWAGVQCAENVLWMNDDIFMLADQSPELGRTLAAPNSWRRGLGQVLMRCLHHGRPVLNFSTHTPYLYQRNLASEVLGVFGCFHKIPFETAYHNWHRTPIAPCVEKAVGPHDLAGKLWINPSFRQVTPAFRQEMARRFGDPPGSHKRGSLTTPPQ
jgi:hypothetical protein